MGPIHGPDDHRFSVLSFDQVQRLDEVMNKPIPIHGRGNFPTLEVRLKDFVSVVRTKLAKHGLHVRDIRLNGGAASYVLLSPDEYDPDADNDNDADSYYNPSPPSPLPSSEVAGLGREITRSPFSLSSQHSTSSSTSTSGVSTMTSSSSSASSSASSTSGASPHPYNDVDLIFAVDLSQQRNFDKVKTATLEALADFFPLNDKRERDRMSVCSMKEGYVHKLVKVTNGEGGDRWSLISLSRVRGRNVELKFVDSMKRQFQFSVDSFQILLDSLLLFYECAEMPMSSNFYPTVVGESMFGDFGESMCHLQEKLIATHCPEEIRGGGLLKYCNLIVRGYRAAEAAKIKTLERYMCSRFFIDFPDLQLQRTKLERYLWDHFSDEDEELTPALRYQYLMTLHRVVDESTVCLMSHERKSTLFLIEELAFEHRPANELGYSAFSCYPNQPYYPNYHHSSKHHQYHHQHQYDSYYQQHQQQQYYYPSGFVLIPNSWMSCA